jgi:hypothetical protein
MERLSQKSLGCRSWGPGLGVGQQPHTVLGVSVIFLSRKRRFIPSQSHTAAKSVLVCLDPGAQDHGLEHRLFLPRLELCLHHLGITSTTPGSLNQQILVHR